jgi:hypothetical protein
VAGMGLFSIEGGKIERLEHSPRMRKWWNVPSEM